jgi:septal ring factor EnvC (AmiA/AmiB activator)
MFWIILPLRSSIDQLRTDDKDIKEDINALKVEVAKNYVQRAEVSSSLARMENKIDMLSARLIQRTDELQDQKADK